MVWDKLARRYDRIWLQRYSLTPTRREVLARVQAHGGARLLDIGCGTGQLIADITATTGIQCVGIDKSSEMIAAAQAKHLPGAQFYNLNICGPLPEHIAHGGFDIITCTHSLPYYDDKAEVIKKIAEIMDENTVLILAQASVNNAYDAAAMYIIEKTAEKADYLSKRDLLALTAGRLRPVEQFDIKEKWFMPSICGFVMKKDMQNESTAG